MALSQNERQVKKMCKKDDCNRHELWGGLCRDHLIEMLNPTPKRKARKKAAVKKVDAVELLTTDEVESKEERNDDNA